VWDVEKTGLIDESELGSMLIDLGFELPTVEERVRLMNNTEKARSSARAVGVENVGKAGEGVNFWVLLQLLRIMCCFDERRVLERETEAAQQNQFSQGEVNGFRLAFTQWVEKDKVFMAYDAMNRFGAQPHHEDPDTVLSEEGLARLLRGGMGLNLGGRMDLRRKLQRKVDTLDPRGRIDFADFLRLMRWALASNFADINLTAHGEKDHDKAEASQ
ncbi:unnamed protein product, partial [Polarella glacialis]